MSISAYALGVVVVAPLLAVAASRLSWRHVLIALMLLFPVSNGLSALAPTYRSMLVLRFVSGLPHGAYFGIASLVPIAKRTQAVARAMLGLTVATIIGVPMANWQGQMLGWLGFRYRRDHRCYHRHFDRNRRPLDVPDHHAHSLGL